MTKRVITMFMMLLAIAGSVSAQYQGWQHSGSLYILTTPEGANLPASASEENFPLLVRLNEDWFDFSQAESNGEDIRFASSEGTPLAYEIEKWDAADGTARVWVKIPSIKGNQRQELKMFWGMADAVSESVGDAVFNESNGYLNLQDSKPTHSADWVKLQYENQKPVQTLVGPLVQTGSDFSVSTRRFRVNEGESMTLEASAGGAQKIYWVVKRLNESLTVASDQFTYNFTPGRVSYDEELALQFQAVYPEEVKTFDIRVNIMNVIPEPVFYLRAPSVWDGRETIEVKPQISNLKAMQDKGVGELKYDWAVSDDAVIKEVTSGKMILKRSQSSGPITVKLTLNNGGADYYASTTIMVTGTDEKPEGNLSPIALSDGAKSDVVTYEPTIESLKQYETPEWFRDAKLGIYMHWGPQSIPGVDPTWYARRMYQDHTDAYKYHTETYGHPSEFGYKDLIKLFTAEKFDQAQADRLTALYKRVGARYVVPVAVHHDNFDMWDSKYQPRFNSVVTSGKDIVGMWKKATDKHGLHLGVASHSARSYRWYQTAHSADRRGAPKPGVPYDGQNPEYADLYGGKWTHSGAFPGIYYERMSDVGPPEWEQNFEDRMLDLIDKYQPDLYYTDGGMPFHQKGLNIVSHLYNENQRWNDGKQQAVATVKMDWIPNVVTMNYEHTPPQAIKHFPWQSDKPLNADWYWVRDATSSYKSAEWAIHTLMDAVSRNGNLLLNVAMTGPGELDSETIAILTEMGECLDIIGEAVFATRPWIVSDDGPGDIRFTRNKQNTVLYVTNLAWANDRLVVKTLGSSKIDLSTLESVTLLGSSEKVTYNQTAEGFIIETPKKPFESPAYAFKLTFSGLIPELNN